MSEYLSSIEAAKLMGVSPSTVKRMCDDKILCTVRTPGGHRRIPADEVSRWLRHSGYADTSAVARSTVPLSSEDVLAFLRKDQSSELASAILEQQKIGRSICQALDDAVAPAMWEIGRQWQLGKLDVSAEHLYSQTLRDALTLMSNKLAAQQLMNRSNRPVAIGCCIGTEQHEIASRMIALVLSEIGYDAKSLGSSLPLDSFLVAIHEMKPDLVWASYSLIGDEEIALEANARLFQSLLPHQKLVIGGQALSGGMRRRMKFHFAGDCLVHLQHYVESVRAA